MSHAAATVAAPRVIREEYPRPPVFSLPQANVLATELVAPQRAPDPPRQGDTPSRPSRRQVFVSLGIDAYHAVMQDEFMVRMWGGPPQVGMPRGAMTPFVHHANIRSPQPVPYGSQITWDATQGEILIPVGDDPDG